MKLGYYPGCSLKGGSREYKESVVAVCRKFDIHLVEVPDWNCCGATAAHNMNKELSLALPARILAQAESAGLDEIVVPCAACYNRLKVTQHEMAHQPELAEKVKAILGMEYKGSTSILNIIQLIEKYILPNLDDHYYRPFNYKAACYYGCLLVRPHSILQFDRAEDPQTMDEAIRKIGGTPVDWEFKVECCGAGMSVSRTDLVAKLTGKVVENALYRKAEVIIVACPMCHSNLDMRRPDVNKYLGVETTIPVLYITQAIGLAVGIDEKTLGLQRHFVPVHLPERNEIVDMPAELVTTQGKEE
ncbi:MAG: CoB--CoM heterodisulfide reductase iron-sulfur subunit B family protein [Bacteroidetes bacterium]|nr:CoB--CoM heterodisulfide reductase iron-sulfur subunit B family protein [Bacteroidota bacterium]